MTNTNKTEGVFEGWVILELMGHRKLGGYLTEYTIAGSPFIRIDVANLEQATVATQFYSASAVYCITPTTQEVATMFGANNKPEPVTRWELPSASPESMRSHYSQTSLYYDDSDDDEDDVSPAYEDNEYEQDIPM